MTRTRAHLFISGMVQGVCYRAYARDAAKQFGLVGWVRNLRNGKVEAVVEGPREIVERFISWCHEGPRYANVSDVNVEWERPSGEFKDLDISF